jgi:hypothetical protein
MTANEQLEIRCAFNIFTHELRTAINKPKPEPKYAATSGPYIPTFHTEAVHWAWWTAHRWQ